MDKGAIHKSLGWFRDSISYLLLHDKDIPKLRGLRQPLAHDFVS